MQRSTVFNNFPAAIRLLFEVWDFRGVVAALSAVPYPRTMFQRAEEREEHRPEPRDSEPPL